MSKPSGEPSFEGALAELEKIVARMEGGELSLEEALAVHRRGLELARFCQQKLEAAQQQVKVLEGDEEVEIVRHLLRLYRLLARHEEGKPLGPHVDAAQAQVLNIVNNFFYEKMTAVPGIKKYIDDLKG